LLQLSGLNTCREGGQSDGLPVAGRRRQADTSAWEREIDERVYRLYGLTEEEIKTIEGSAKGGES
jgi:hypothetical protein